MRKYNPEGQTNNNEDMFRTDSVYEAKDFLIILRNIVTKLTFTNDESVNDKILKTLYIWEKRVEDLLEGIPEDQHKFVLISFYQGMDGIMRIGTSFKIV